MGVTTAGAFVSGKGIFASESKPYILFLSVAGMLLDGIDIEGVGVKADYSIEYPVTESLDSYPQLLKGLALMEKEI